PAPSGGRLCNLDAGTPRHRTFPPTDRAATREYIVAARGYNWAMAVKSAPFSLRLSKRIDARVSALAKQTRRSKADVIESLIDEADRCRRYPGIAFRGEESTRRPWIVGSSFDVWQIIRALQDFQGDAERMARESEVSLRQIQLAVAYYHEFPAEIDEAIALDRRSLAELQAEYPFFGSIVVDA